MNAYRQSFADELGGYRTDATWDKFSRVMACCGAKVYWRHLIDCPKAPRNWPDDLSDLKEI